MRLYTYTKIIYVISFQKSGKQFGKRFWPIQWDLPYFLFLQTKVFLFWANFEGLFNIYFNGGKTQPFQALMLLVYGRKCAHLEIQPSVGTAWFAIN